jgi:hypothetical protein
LAKADMRVIHALKCKLERESQWTRKMCNNGSKQWHLTYETATQNSDNQPWQKTKSEIKSIAFDNRKKFWKDYINPLLQQGNLLKFLDLQSCDLTWRSLIFNLPRGVLSFAVRACIDFLPTLSNLKNWGKRGTDKCKLCGNRETLNHILNSCPVSLEQGRLTWRHNSILIHILKLLKVKFSSATVYSDIQGHSTCGGTIPPNILVTKLKPDICVLHEDGDRIDLVELTVPFETNTDKAHSRKQTKYADLVNDLNQKGYTYQLYCVEVGSRGLITQENEKRLSSIFQASRKEVRTLKKELSNLALVSSYTIWNARHCAVWENSPHISC